MALYLFGLVGYTMTELVYHIYKLKYSNGGILTPDRIKGKENKPCYVYDRGVIGKRWADMRIKELADRGVEAVYLLNHRIKDAFY